MWELKENEIQLSNKKIIKIKEIYTRKIDREFNSILMKDSNSDYDTNWIPKISFKPDQIYIAQDYLVKSMTWLTQEDIDEMSVKDYDLILTTINKIKNPSQK